MRNWENFYKNGNLPNTPSSFAQFCADWLPEERLLIWDVGCGNGRDTYFFAKQGHLAIGLDKYSTPTDKDGARFYKDDFGERDLYGDVLYSRFFLHTVERNRTADLIQRSKCRYIMAECRSTGDEPTVYKDHDRHFVDGGWLLETLAKSGYEVLFFQKSTGLAKYKGEDPLIIRVVAKKRE